MRADPRIAVEGNETYVYHIKDASARQIFDYFMDVAANTSDREFAEQIVTIAGDALLCADEFTHTEWVKIRSLQATVDELMDELKSAKGDTK